LKHATTTGASDLIAANKAAARAAGLRYVSDTDPGITRHRSGSGFVYNSASGKKITDHDEFLRIKALVIPPAWTDVWICPYANGHIQAVGRDARGRKQYRYHTSWREARDNAKYHKMIQFAEALPKIRRTVRKQLAKPGLPREKVLAAVIAIMEKTLIRVGNDEYASSNGSYGLTTMRDKHARVAAGKVEFRFRGKSGVEHEIDLEDPKLVEIVRKCRELPGQELFQYRDDDGKVCDITSTDVNAYLREISGGDFTAKDFRTWAGTVLAARALREFDAYDSKTQAKKNLVRAIEKVAMRLGNTKAVCRKCYIHPVIIDSYLDGELVKHFSRKAERILSRSTNRLSTEETAVLGFIRRSIHRRAA
jgi:DNA topoisomerase-1